MTLDTHTTPARGSAAIFRLKAGLLQLGRSCRNAADPTVRRWGTGSDLAEAPVRGESTTTLHPRDETPEERDLVLGKIQNIRVAAGSLHGVEVAAGGVLSFWSQLGRPASR